jgi:hypothetical protein
MKTMVRRLAAGCAVATIAYSLYGFDLFDEFKRRIEQAFVDPAAQDLTALTCMNGWTGADPLGLVSAMPPSIGLNVRVYNNIVQPVCPMFTAALQGQSFNYLTIPVLQVEKGLPFNVDVAVRGMAYGVFMFYGAGVKWTAFKSFLFGVPDVALSFFYNSMSAADILSFNSTSLAATVSVGLPIIKPYVTAAYDSGMLTVADTLLRERGIPLSTLEGKFSGGTRLEIGLNLQPLPFIYANACYGLSVYGNTGFSGSVGLRF